jgi:hypothetical protein
LPLDNLNLFKHPLPEPSTPNSHDRFYFGEEIKANSPIFEKTHALSSDDSLDAILSSVRDVGNSKSSSSSLSWGEEYKSDASKQVRAELERMDRVLRGEEPIPANYDAEEYEEWMEFFPNLCVLGTKTGTCTKSSGAAPAPVDEILAIDPEDTCDKLETSDQIKKAVIDQIYEKIAVNAPKITLNLDEIDVDSYLKVSPLGGASRLTRRQSSSRSLISSQISSSKWLKDDDYSSLPFLGVKPERNGVPKGILKNALVLPPIETCQIRSVSATPRRQSKSLSALSVKEQKYSGFKRKGDKDTFK